MNNNKKMLILISAIIALAIAAVGGILLILAVCGEYDIDVGHFAADAVYAPFAYGALGAGVVLALVLAFLSGKSRIMHGKNAGAFLSFASVFAAILLIASVVFSFVDRSTVVEEGYNTFVYAAVAFGIGGAVALFMFALSGSYRTKLAKVLSFCLPLYFVMRTLILYFDKTVAINSSVKIITQLAFVAFALFAIFDAGVYVGREKILPRYLFGCVCAQTVGGSVSIAALVSQFTVAGSFELSVVDTCMLLAFFLLVCAKMHHIAFAVAEAKTAEEEKVESNE